MARRILVIVVLLLGCQGLFAEPYPGEGTYGVVIPVYPAEGDVTGSYMPYRNLRFDLGASIYMRDQRRVRSGHFKAIEEVGYYGLLFGLQQYVTNRNPRVFHAIGSKLYFATDDLKYVDADSSYTSNGVYQTVIANLSYALGVEYYLSKNFSIAGEYGLYSLTIFSLDNHHVRWSRDTYRNSLKATYYF